jgi:osmotically inducible protein OsmC
MWFGRGTHGRQRNTDGGGQRSSEGGPVTFASRTQSPESMTNPEELIASTHATCYAMALSNTLAT